MEFKKLHISLAILLGTISFGTIGYYFIEGMPLFDAFYMTIITISTVGFSEIIPLSPYGRVITIIMISTSISIGAYSIGVIVRMFIEGELRKGFGRIKLEKQISKLKNHFIICGFGRIGKVICTELACDNIDFVVIEQDENAIEDLENKNFLYLQTDATTDEALIEAGIMRAEGLVTSVKSDANNVFITLTAKGLRPDIFIMSRTSDVKNVDKLKRAGASRVVSPYYIGGRRMAQILKRPTVVDFIDIATMDSQLGLMMEEAKLGPGSNLIGKNLIESNLRKDFGVIIVAIKKLSGDMIFNPMPSEKLEAGDVIVVLGKKDDMRRMNEVL
ncbi:MAG: potassium channel protein [Desulfobacterales bacterium]|nr:potassium channel protein [Desulfobacterales bacterium]